MQSGSIPGLATTQARDRPVLFLIDDDAGVVRALREDLSRRFGQDFRVIGEASATAGLKTLRDLAGQHERVALLIVDHHMREMPGAGFLARAHEMHPLAKRVLLVERDYSACSPVVQAMTLGQADYHLTKPWMLEQDLYCVISEFLAEWAKDQEAGFDLFHVIGGQQDPGTSELRELLTRFNVPFHFHAAGSEEGRRLLRNKGLPAARLPVVIRHDDYTMVQPTPAQIVESVGGSTRTDVAACDVVIAGAGPAGLAAAVYAASEGLQTVVLEETVSGGQAGSSPMIRNYPGFAHGISGYELTRRACEQAWMFGAHMVFSQPIVGVECAGSQRIVHLADSRQIAARAVIVAPGIAWRRLGVPHLESKLGAGVFYGVAGGETAAMGGCDVFVVGAGNSAGQAALHLARHARQVTILVRGDSLARSMSDYLIREIEATANVTVRLNTEVTDGHGAHHLEALTLHDRLRHQTVRVPAAALFVLIGGEPRTQWLPPTVQLKGGYILTGRDVVRTGEHSSRWPLDRAPLLLETSIPGVFAAGDARYRSIKRVASAVGDGATAVRLVQEYLAEDAGLLPVLPDEPLLRLLPCALVETGRAGPVAPEAGRVVQVPRLDELALDQQGHDETEPASPQVVQEPGGRNRGVVPACPRGAGPGVVGPLSLDDRSVPVAGDIPEHRVPRAVLVHSRRAMLAVFQRPVTGDVVSPRLVQQAPRADPLDPEQVGRPGADVVGQGLHPEVVATAADATIAPERPAARRPLRWLVEDVEHHVRICPEVSGEGSPEGLAPPRRHGLHQLGGVQLPLEVQHHHQIAAFREVHFGADRLEERPADVASGADQIRLADLEPDGVRAPVVRGSGDARLILGHLGRVVGVGQPGEIDPVRDVPSGGAGNDRPADAERPFLVVAGCCLGTRRLAVFRRRPRAGRRRTGYPAGPPTRNRP
jgi:thioredoxin reductase (NADPH)